MDQRIAKRYARAFFGLVETEKKTKEAMRDMDNLGILFEASDEFRRFCADPVMAPAEKAAVLEQVLKGKMHALTLQFLVFLIKKGRLAVLPQIITHFMTITNDAQKILKARVESHAPLSQSQRRSIEQHLNKKFNKTIDASWDVNKELIGGVKIDLNGVIYDYSVSHQLGRFQESLSYQ